MFQAFGVEDKAVKSMLEAIQEMKFFSALPLGTQKSMLGALLKLRHKDYVKTTELPLQAGLLLVLRQEMWYCFSNAIESGRDQGQAAVL